MTATAIEPGNLTPVPAPCRERPGCSPGTGRPAGCTSATTPAAWPTGSGCTAGTRAYFIIADLHMLTTKNSPADIAEVGRHAADMVLDSLAAGLDPAHSVFYLQSAVPEVAELSLLLSSLVTVPRLQRIPSLKEMGQHAGQREMPLALLGYPVLQAADILAVQAAVVPVGKDNAAHVEVAREMARRFNRRYGEVFTVPALVPARGAGAAGHRRPGQDEQEPGQRHLPVRPAGARSRRRCGACTPTRPGPAPACPARSRATRCSSTTTPSTTGPPRSRN